MTIYTIYRATNKISEKCYIGFDCLWPRRKRQHLNQKTHDVFHNAIQAYGKDAFMWEILYQSEDGEHTLKTMESYFIQENNSFYLWENGGYNMTLGGDGQLGIKGKNHWAYGTKQTETLKIKRGLYVTGIKRPYVITRNKSEYMKAVARRKKPGTAEKMIGNTHHKHNEKVNCPHCHQIGSYVIMQRWHFDKCRKIS